MTTPTTCAGVLSRLTIGMIECHERTCEIAGEHRWEACTATPSIYAVADALDAIDGLPELAAGEVPVIARAMHDRECQEGTCGPWDTDQQDRHAASWRDQAGALLVWCSSLREQPEPVVPDSRRGNLMARCECSHIRRGHSVDGSRCYASPCTCGAEGGFRAVAA